MLGQLLKLPFWAVVAVPELQHHSKNAVRIILLQHSTEDALQEEIVHMTKQFKGMEVLSDYTQIALN